MRLELPHDIADSLHRFITFGGYENEAAVLRAALAALQHELDLRAIKEGIEDMEAGRCRPAREVLAEIRQKFDFKAEC